MSAGTALRRIALAACVLAGGILPAQRGWADTTTVSGQQLVLDTSLSEGVAIETDHTLSGNVRVTMDGSLSCLSIVSGHTAVISASNCSEESGELHIAVSPDMAVTVASHSDGDIHVGDLRSPLVASLTSSGDLIAGNVGSLVLTIRGNGDATIGDVGGPATIDIAGSGDVKIRELHGALYSKQVGSGNLTIGAIESDGVTMELTGSGDALLGSGKIGSLMARASGSSNLEVGAEIRDADVQASGGSDMKFARVTGHISRLSSSGSEIEVGGNPEYEPARSEHGRRTGSTTSDGASLSDLARKMAEAAGAQEQVRAALNRAGSGDRNVIVLHQSSGYETHLAIIFGIIVLFIGYRLWRRSGRATPVTGPSNPGVLAVCEAMTRLDQRLSRLENYVTTKEFDLNRKFREL